MPYIIVLSSSIIQMMICVLFYGTSVFYYPGDDLCPSSCYWHLPLVTSCLVPFFRVMASSVSQVMIDAFSYGNGIFYYPGHDLCPMLWY